MKKTKLPIYLDYQATTPMDKRVLDAMMDTMTREFGNAHSSSHLFGWNASKLVEKARKQIAGLINAKPENIIFTSGATESNNLVIKGLKKPGKNHIISIKTEHKCVLEALKYMKKQGYEITLLDVDHDGLISLENLRANIKENTLLVSTMGVNNEIGVIQPLEEIGKICKEFGVYFHSDCAQAFGKIPLDVENMNIDLMSISGHKIYGPKGIGAVYVRDKIKLEPILHGGGQERKMRAGTLAVPLIVGFGKAAEIASKSMVKDAAHVKKLFDILYDEMMKIERCYLNGSKEYRWFGNANYSFAGIEGESIMIRIKEVAVSSGSACTSEDLNPSYVIAALGGDPELAHSSIRFGFGRFTTEEDIEYAAKRITEEVAYLRKMSPLWDEIVSRV